MAKTIDTYKQCSLEYVTDGIRHMQVAYIPENLAHIGKTIELKTDGIWDGILWTVMKTSNRVAVGKEIMKKLHDSWGSLDMPRRRGK